MTKADFELISDADKYLFFEKGGFCYIHKRYSKANNKYLKSNYEKLESKHIMYLDENNSCRVTRCLNFFQQADLNRKTLKSLTRLNRAVIV